MAVKLLKNRFINQQCIDNEINVANKQHSIDMDLKHSRHQMHTYMKHIMEINV